MPNGGRTAKNGNDKREKNTISVAGSTKNATQLLHQNIRQNASLYGRDGGTNVLFQHRLFIDFTPRKPKNIEVMAMRKFHPLNNSPCRAYHKNAGNDPKAIARTIIRL
ncbi:hypothetical protein [Hallella sp.]|uniref:hypothetical protein n=1 Tax=Hallella sp. TaxID=2980186 RepID=UPI003078E6A2